MSGKLVIKQAFGINPNIKNCLVFTEEHHLAYLCGHQIAVINTESKDQNFITGTNSYQHQSLGISAMVVSLAKKIIAVAEKVEPAAIITLYDAHTLRKKRLLTYNELGSNEIRCIAFSEDGRFMLVQGCGPDWNLVLWSIEKAAKVVTSVKISQSDETPVHQVSFCPWDSSVVLVIGRSILRMFRFSEGQLRQIQLIVRRESANFISHVWLPEDNLLIGTDSGDIMYIENFEFRGYISTSSGQEGEVPHPVLCLAPYARGFVMGSHFGELKLFERQEDLKEKYALEDACSLPGERPGHILTFAVGPDDGLACATDRQQLLSISLSNLIGIKEGTGGVENILTSFHGPSDRGEAAITGIDVALWKHILVTTGRDCTVRVWNTSDKRMELMKTFEDEPIGLSVHPSGLYIAVAFSEKILILSLLLEEIHIVRELVARQCSGIKFSHGGQYLAAMNGSNLQLYSTFTGASVGTLRGHNNKIRSVVWMQADAKIMTIGSEGMVYFWDLFPVTRRPEHFAGAIPITSGSGPMDGSKVFITTQEKLLKELDFSSHGPISSMGSAIASAAAVLGSSAAGLEGAVQITKSTEMNGHYSSCMLYDEVRKLLIMGTQAEDIPGSILTVSVAGQISNQLEVNSIHSGAISAMCTSRDGNMVISGDVNGIICISEFESAAHSKQVMKEGIGSFEFIDEVLIHKSDLDYRKGQINLLTGKVAELNSNNEHQLRLKDLEHSDKKQEIEDKFNTQLEAERLKFNELEAEKRQIEKDFAGKVTSLEQYQADELKAIEFKYKTKQNAEENRHRVLQEETEDAHKRWNSENAALVESHQKYLQELTVEYEEKLLAEQYAQKDLVREKDVLKVNFDSQQQETEIDGDHEVAEMKIRYDTKLKQEEETALQLMQMHAIMTKTHDTLVKDSNQQKVEIKRLKDKESRLYETIYSLEKDIQSHKKEIREREETITDKEKRIFDLKKKNQELEKFRFVLDYKIKELKLQIAPRENEINTMRTQIGEMDLELDQYNKSNLALNLMIEELRLKLDGVKRELLNQEERCAVSERLMERFKRDLQELWALRNDQTAFKASMIKMYRIYVQEDISPSMMAGGAGGRGTDMEDPQQVYNRDREQMERSLDSLRRSMKTEAVAHKRDLGKMMRESVMLTKELNNLRKQARSMQMQKKAIEQAGDLGPQTDLNELMMLIGVHVKKVAANPGAAGDNNTNDAAGGDLMPPAPPGMTGRRSAGASGGGTRTAALKTTHADGKMVLNSRGGGGGGGGASTGRTGRQDPRQDQWEAWREIQMQYDQMKQLEDSLMSVCYSLNIDPIPVIVGIDTSLM